MTFVDLVAEGILGFVVTEIILVVVSGCWTGVVIEGFVEWVAQEVGPSVAEYPEGMQAVEHLVLLEGSQHFDLESAMVADSVENRNLGFGEMVVHPIAFLLVGAAVDHLLPEGYSVSNSVAVLFV